MLCFIDFETFYSEDYTLKKLTPAEYILDPRFVCHGLAVQYGEHGKPFWIEPGRVDDYFALLRSRQARGHKIAVATYNSLFDKCIMAWRYNFAPDLMIDVLGMVRATYGPALRRASLASVAKYLDIGEKGTVIQNVIGMSVADIRAAGMWDAYVAYGIQDVALMVGIYRHIMPSFPVRELGIMDLVLRCCVQPQFKFNKALLDQHLIDVVTRKAELLASCGLEYDEHGKCPDLMSAKKFENLLISQGVTVEYKTTLTGRTAPAIAKTDQFMSDLLEHDNETVAALAAARLGHKSTLQETRTKRFISIAVLPDAPGYRGGSAPMPLRYGAAHTHRLGGDWLLNVQNLPRGGKLRESITVEDDEEVVSGDEAQVEARTSAWIAKERTLLREFAQNLDPYGQLGATIFSLPAPLSKKQFSTEHPIERFIGKTGILGLGYQAGAIKFHTMVNTLARLSLKPEQLVGFKFDEADAERAVRIYRNRYHRMPHIWRILGTDGISALTGNGPSFVLHPVVIKRGVIWGPNGQRTIYPDLKQDPSSGEWTYRYGNQRAKIYGGKLLENITQWIARIIVMEAGLRLYHNHGLRFALQAHDELVYVIKKPLVAQAKKIIKMEMERRPTWAEDLPLEAEVGSGPNYKEAK